MKPKVSILVRLLTVLVLALGFLPRPTGVAAEFTCPCSIWGPTATPDVPAINDGSPVELGVKFRSDVDGYITGIRFYKGAGNTGDHYGHLWASDGTLLSEVLFTNESASGWQEATLATPTAISANVTYIVSYHAPNGHYSYSGAYFGAQIYNEPLRALANGDELPGNGVFLYGPSGSFPSQSYNQTNYWVDVVFDTVPVRPKSIWGSSGTPTSPSATDGVPIEVGVKFRSAQSGAITGLRYYKGPGVTGTHIGHLWSQSGNLLGTLTFTNETAQGWQESLFDTPVSISANTTYIASYFSPDGFFAISSGYFTAGVDSPPLRALANGEDGPNGVFNYTSSGFPATSGNGSNYWADVLFVPDAPTDTTPPTVTAASPGSGAGGVSTAANVTATFSESIALATLTSETFTLQDSANQPVTAVLTYDGTAHRAILDPDSALAYSTTYTARVKGGPAGVTDIAGNALAVDYTWSFTTAASPPPPPDQGPGGPILVIADSGNPFGRYFAEILRAEGLNSFAVADISAVNSTLLTDYRYVILGEMALTPARVQMLTDWVTAGGNLIAMRPDKQLADLFGLSDANATISNAYLKIDTVSGPGAGLVAETIQFHGAADLYTLTGATALATLYSDATTATVYPAATVRNVGSSGGQAAAFTFDLARSIVYTRQGNPAWVGDERDGVGPLRSDDMFYGAKAGDVQPDWIDLNKVAIPQADEQQRLLANLILSLDPMPLPRFWYFPRGEKAVVIMTGDDHGGSASTSRFNTYLAQSPANCSVDNWECIRASTYLYTNNTMTDALALNFHNLGFEVGLHPDTGCGNFTQASFDDIYTSQLADWRVKFPSIPDPSTERTHCIAWSGWVTHAQVEITHGSRLDTNYYYWPPAWLQDRPGLFTGSGMPMRFADLDGTMIDVYQATTQMTDESGQSYPYTIDALLDKALGAQGYYGAFTANMHTDSNPHAGSEAIVASALARGVPIVSGRQMLQWLDGRNGSSFQNLSWNSPTLNFEVTIGAGANGLQVMLPTQAQTGPLSSLTLNGNPVAFSVQTIKGIQYAVFNAAAGLYQANYIPDTTPPAITNVSASPLTNGTATIGWTTDEPADSTVHYGLAPDELLLSAALPALVNNHQITLNYLAPGATYYYRVTSVDGSANSATWPPVASLPASFSTPAAVLADTTAADFSSGTPGACLITQTGNGEVMLAPTAGAEFDGSTLPAGWNVAPWSGGGGYTISGGKITINDALLSQGLFPAEFGPGRSIEFVATLNPYNSQHIGFGTDLNAGPWAIFSTGSPGGNTLVARTLGSDPTNTPLPGITLGTPHRFRIDWSLSAVSFYVDGALVATHTVGLPTANMRFVASDITNPGPDAPLVLDWMRMSPFTSPCTFQSRIFDAGQSVQWNSIAWTGELPSGTAFSLSYRIGSTPAPDGSWTGFSNLGASPAALAGSSRYIQYQVELTGADDRFSPALQDVQISYAPGADVTPPTIVSRSPAPNAVGIGLQENVVVQFSEPINPATVTPGTFRLRQDGAAADTAAAITLAGDTATLNPDQSLEPGKLYHVTVGSAVADLAGNPLGSDDTWSFTTLTPPTLLGDDSTADFNSGTPDANLYIANMDDGEVMLAPALIEEFATPGLPSGWSSFPWTGGSAAAANGVLIVDGARANTNLYYSPGLSVEFEATFGAAANQHAGLGDNLEDGNQGWALFSTFGGSTNLYARTNNFGAFQDVLIPGSWLGAPHRYRIEWNPSSIRFYIDGSPVHTAAVSIAANMRPIASDLNNGGPVLSVDWLHLSPYPAAGTFQSRVFDAGAAVDWVNLTWTGETPAGTGLSMSVRSGNTPTPDGTWSAFTPVAASGDPTGQTARYIQYRAALTTSDPLQTPFLADATFGYLSLPNQAPAAAGDSYTTDEDTLLTVVAPGILGNDTDPNINNLTAILVAGPAHGMLALNPNGSFSYTPAANWYGPDGFTYKANDGSLDSSTVAVAITVNPVNDPPVAAGDSYSTNRDTPLSVPAPGVLGNDTDIDSPTITAVLVSGAAHGTLALTSNGSFTYTPTAGFSGADSFTYRATDGAAPGNTVTVNLTVNAPAEPICITIQRGVSGLVQDAYIWEALPTSSYSAAATLYTGIRVHATRGEGQTYLLLRFDLSDLPQGAQVQSAALHINVFGTPSGQNINLYRMTSAWSENTTATWNNLHNQYDPATVWGSYNTSAGQVPVNITSLAAAWARGDYANHGLMLINPAGGRDNYRGSEYTTPSARPHLELCYLPSLGPAVGVTISPASSAVPAGAAQAYQLTAHDSGGHTWDVTAQANFSIQQGAGGSWNANVYTAENFGDWTVTGTFNGLSDTAQLTVSEHGQATSIQLTPASTTMTAGDSAVFQATAADDFGHFWDVTADTIFSTPVQAGGAWSANSYTSQAAGVWTVTGTYQGLSGSALLSVLHAAAVGLDLTPAAASIPAGASITYHATAIDGFGNTWDVTSATAYSITSGAGGGWNGSVYTSQQAGTWTVSAVYGAVNDTATLVVTPSVEPTCMVIQRGVSGSVQDAYIWQSLPTSNYAAAPTLYTGQRIHATRGEGETQLLARFDLTGLPAGASIQSATLGLTIFNAAAGQTIQVYPMTQAWGENSGATWNALANAHEATTAGQFTTQNGAVSVNLTNLVRSWADGSRANYGVALFGAAGLASNSYRASEYTNTIQRPSLQICYLPVTNTAGAVAAQAASALPGLQADRR